jgi:broad specificity phosphatase PhoE
VQGFTESRLSELGREQSRRLRARLEGVEIDAVWSSPLSRAVDTCRIAMDGRVPVQTHDGLREMHLGAWEGRKATELRREFPEPVRLWFQQPSRVRIDGGETMRAFRIRVTGAMEAVRASRSEGTIAVFTHGGVVCAWLTRLLGMTLDNIWRFKIRNGSVTRVVFTGERPRIDLLGDVSHLGDAVRELPGQRHRMLP